MKGTELVTAWLLWQSALLVHIGTAAAPEHLRFERALQVPAAAKGLACATLDPTVLTHTASAAHNDLRIFREDEGSHGRTALEIPYTLTESGPEPVADAEAAMTGVTRTGDTLHFDLQMPQRAYSELDLQVRLHDFVGTVIVTSGEGKGRARALGTFGIFDLTQKGLGRWTALELAETAVPGLHITLRLRTPEGRPISKPPLAVVAGATVPPSRLRQTVYTPVATAETTQRDEDTVALLHVPAHVPVERVAFQLATGATGNYLRHVVLRARTDGVAAAGTEVLDAGTIQHVQWAPGDPQLNPIQVTQMDVDATTGATLAGPATVRVLIENATQPALPLRSVTLEMRERKLCFPASLRAHYTLRYGDAALAAPVYDISAFSGTAAPPVTAILGPERGNPQWRARQDRRPYLHRHPEVFWLVMLVAGGSMGAAGLGLLQARESRGA